MFWEVPLGEMGGFGVESPKVSTIQIAEVDKNWKVNIQEVESCLFMSAL